MSVQLQKDTLYLKALNYLGKELYTTSIIK